MNLAEFGICRASAAEAAGRSAQALRPTFADFDPQSIAMAARETEPYMAQDAAFMPHSAEELDAATRLPREHGRTGFLVPQGDEAALGSDFVRVP